MNWREILVNVGVCALFVCASAYCLYWLGRLL